MGTMKNIIDGNEAASKYAEYMRKARRDGDKMPTRRAKTREQRQLVRELNNELDKLQFGYRAEQTNAPDVCCRCGGPLGEGSKIVRSIYPDRQPRIDIYKCGQC